jgi:hypothetical protein
MAQESIAVNPTSNRIDALSREIALAIERRRLLLFVAFSLFYFTTACLAAAWKPMWFDELVTFDASRLPSVAMLLHALRLGFDQQPPPYTLLTYGSVHLFGASALAIRLPSIIGLWVAVPALYWLLAGRMGTLCAAMAGLLVFTTLAAEYSIEGRPYGVLVGCAALAFAVWRWAGQRRGVLPGLLFAASAVLLTDMHYYAVLSLGALIVGELVRSWRRRAVDWRLWPGFAAAVAPPVYFYLAYARAPVADWKTWNPPRLPEVLNTYQYFLDPAMLVMAGLIAAIAVFSYRRSKPGSGERARTLDPEEWAVIAVFALLPFAAYLLGIFAGFYTARYVLPAVLAFSVIFPLAVFRSGGRDGVITVIAFVLVVLLVGEQLATTAIWQHRRRDLYGPDIALFKNAPGDLPIVIAAPKLYYEVWHYSDPAVRSRLWYLTDPASAAAYTAANLHDLTYPVIRRFVPIQIEAYRAFLESHRSFYVYAIGDPFAWVVRKLSDERVPMTIVRDRGAAMLLKVEQNGQGRFTAPAVGGSAR